MEPKKCRKVSGLQLFRAVISKQNRRPYFCLNCSHFSVAPSCSPSAPPMCTGSVSGGESGQTSSRAKSVPRVDDFGAQVARKACFVLRSFFVGFGAS